MSVWVTRGHVKVPLHILDTRRDNHVLKKLSAILSFFVMKEGLNINHCSLTLSLCLEMGSFNYYDIANQCNVVNGVFSKF